MAKAYNPDKVNWGQGVPDYYLPGGEQWATALDSPTYIGSMRGRRHQIGNIARRSKYQWIGDEIGEAKYKYDYDKLGLDDSLLNQLTGIFQALGTGTQKQSGTQYGVWEEDPDVAPILDTDPDSPTYGQMIAQYGVDPMAEGTGAEGKFSFLDYANIFDKEQYGKMLEMITGEDIDIGMLPDIEGKDIAQTKDQYYTPLEIGHRENILDSIIGRYQDVGTGGFAGSGGRRRKLGGVRDTYTKEMEDVWAEISKRKMEGIESLSNKFSDIYNLSRGTTS